MKKFFKILLWVLVGAVFIGTFVYLYISNRPKDDVYETVHPSTETIERSTVLTGKIEPRDEIEIKPQISGIIAEVLVEAGDQVKAGDIIAKIKVIPDESQLSSAQSRVSIAQISLEEARQTFERTKNLYERKFESREKFETDQHAYDRARQELAQAEDQLAIVKEGVSSLNAQGSNTLVRSTVTGLVLEVPVKVGSSVIQSNTFNDGTTIAKVADMTDILFNGKVDETEVDLLSEGMPVRIAVGAVAGSDYAAVIEKIAPIATDDNGSNTFEVKAAMTDQQTGRLRAGYSANATIILESVKDVLAVPERVVEYASDSAFVYVLTAEKPKQEFKRTYIKTGVSDGINVQVLEGDITAETSLRGNKQE